MAGKGMIRPTAPGEWEGRFFDRRKPAFDTLWHDIGPRIDSLEHSVSREIEAQLDPDQRTKYAELRRRFDERRRRGPPTAPPE